MHLRGLFVACLVSILGVLPACQDETAPSDEDWGIDDPTFEDFSTLGKADSFGVKALPVSVEGSETQVWEVRNQWEDRDTPEARKAGIAWPANSGLNWDEKYALWIQSMEKTASEAGWYDTFMLTTPWGKTLPAPKLECAELAMFLRVAFAAWYHLPFYMTAVDAHGTRVYFGHFGARTRSGRYKNTPKYKLWYRDYTEEYADLPQEELLARWPKDERLRSRGIGDDDQMDFLFPGARAGAYFDEIFLNKRVGHFLRLLLTYFGSVNLVSSRNTYNLKPEAVRAGDVLLERWQRRGIGHTLVVKKVDKLDGGRINAELVSGSMPRRQPKWEDGASSKSSFTSVYTGGDGTNPDGEPYYKLGGGLKRWRVAKVVDGYWVNTWMAGDEASWISDTDYDRIKARPQEFEELLGEVSPEELRESLLRRIEDARNHLREYPASCAARERREEAFRELYELNRTEFGLSKEETDRQYRKLEDYVFAELVYERSKTCCWNSSTSAMYQIIMDYNRSLMEDQCTEPVVFKAVNGGYEVFRQYAEETGRGHLWKPWSEDEPCPQRDTQNDVEAEHDWIPWCDVADGEPSTPECQDDPYEDNDTPTQAKSLDEGTYPGLEICTDDEDYYQVELPSGQRLEVQISFDHNEGDLDLALYRDGEQVAISQGVEDTETVSADEPGTYLIRVYGYQGASASYILSIAMR